MWWLRALGRKGEASTEPRSNILKLDNPTSREPNCGLIPVYGWAFVKGASDPARSVEVWVEGQERVVAQDRFLASGVDPSCHWAARVGFRVTINSFFLPNGWHTLRVRLTDSGREVKAWRGKFWV